MQLDTIVQGDCLQVMAGMDTSSIAAVITDPPYGIRLENHGDLFAWDKDTIVQGDHSTEIGQIVLDWAARLGLCTVAFASPKKPWRGEWRSLLVWDKGPAVGGGGDIKTCWKYTWELIQVARNKPLNGNRDSAVLKYYVGPNSYHYHPTQKPLALLEYLISKVTQPGDLIFDPFIGSGTTAVAAKKLGRHYYGCDISEKYVTIALKRLEETPAPLFTM
jgi:site-specific DNA-methyltransferase (adenine-specific)